MPYARRMLRVLQLGIRLLSDIANSEYTAVPPTLEGFDRIPCSQCHWSREGKESRDRLEQLWTSINWY